MSIVKGYFDELNFTQSNIEKFELISCNINIYIASGLDVFIGHPLGKTYKFSDACKLIFENTIFSKQIIYEYTEDGNSFKEKKVIEEPLESVCKQK